MEAFHDHLITFDLCPSHPSPHFRKGEAAFPALCGRHQAQACPNLRTILQRAVLKPQLHADLHLLLVCERCLHLWGGDPTLHRRLRLLNQVADDCLHVELRGRDRRFNISRKTTRLEEKLQGTADHDWPCSSRVHHADLRGPSLLAASGHRHPHNHNDRSTHVGRVRYILLIRC